MISATTTTRRTALTVSCAVLLATATLLAGCSSSSSSGHDTASSTGSGTIKASTDTSTGTTTASAGTSTSTPSKATSTTSSSGGGSVSLGSGSFCAVARNQEAEQKKQVNAFTGGRAQLKALEEKDAKLLPEFLAIAPAAIKPDVAILVAADQKLVVALRKANYDFSKLDQTTLASFSTPALTKASQHITTYLTKTCGIKEPDGAPTS